MLRHKAPVRSNFYGKNFTKTNICRECNIVGSKEDIPIHLPCCGCGGKITKYELMSWDNYSTKWLTVAEHSDLPVARPPKQHGTPNNSKDPSFIELTNINALIFVLVLVALGFTLGKI